MTLILKTWPTLIIDFPCKPTGFEIWWWFRGRFIQSTNKSPLGFIITIWNSCAFDAPSDLRYLYLISMVSYIDLIWIYIYISLSPFVFAMTLARERKEDCKIFGHPSWKTDPNPHPKHQTSAPGRKETTQTNTKQEQFRNQQEVQ